VSVLVDSSVWIAYFRGADSGQALDTLIDENLVVTNDLILTELEPALRMRRQEKLINLLREITRPPIKVDWDDLIRMQLICLRNGINKVGVPDLIIAQHAIHCNLQLMSLDKHFGRMAHHLPLTLLPM
jgi:predicted nucleic acid-binding protein